SYPASVTPSTGGSSSAACVACAGFHQTPLNRTPWPAPTEPCVRGRNPCFRSSAAAASCPAPPAAPTYTRAPLLPPSPRPPRPRPGGEGRGFLSCPAPPGCGGLGWGVGGGGPPSGQAPPPPCRATPRPAWSLPPPSGHASSGPAGRPAPTAPPPARPAR